MATVPDIAPAGPDNGGLWLSVSELAEKKGITRQSMAERIKALVAAGKIATKPGPRRTKLVMLAEFDRATGEVTDPAKLAGAQTHAADLAADAGLPTAAPAKAGDGGYLDARARGAQYDADLKEIDLKQKLGELVSVADVEAAMSKAAETIVRIVDRITSNADMIAAAVGKDGVPGARAALKEISRDLRQSIAQALNAESEQPDQTEAESEQAAEPEPCPSNSSDPPDQLSVAPSPD